MKQNTLIKILSLALLLGGLISCQESQSRPQALPSFELKFKFKQDSVAQGRFRIAVPQSIPGVQEIHRIDFQPRPSQIDTLDGEVYAEFIYLFPKDSLLEFGYEAFFTLSRQPKPILSSKTSLQEERYLRFKDTTFQEHLQSHTQIPPSDYSEKFYPYLHQYTQNFLQATDYQWKDQGLKQLLRTKKGDCTEFADYIVSFCRAHEIPALAHSGYVYVDSTTQPHSWAQCQDYMMDALLQKNFQDPLPPGLILSSTRNPERLLGKRFLHFDWVRGQLIMQGYPQAEFKNLHLLSQENPNVRIQSR